MNSAVEPGDLFGMIKITARDPRKMNVLPKFYVQQPGTKWEMGTGFRDPKLDGFFSLLAAVMMPYYL